MFFLHKSVHMKSAFDFTSLLRTIFNPYLPKLFTINSQLDAPFLTILF